MTNQPNTQNPPSATPGGRESEERMYLGPVTKPFHKNECQCPRCLQWMVDRIADLELMNWNWWNDGKRQRAIIKAGEKPQTLDPRDSRIAKLEAEVETLEGQLRRRSGFGKDLFEATAENKRLQMALKRSCIAQLASDQKLIVSLSKKIAALEAEVKQLQEALLEAAELSEHADRTAIYNHCHQAAEDES